MLQGSLSAIKSGRVISSDSGNLRGVWYVRAFGDGGLVVVAPADERLVSFVGEMVSALGHVRRRENALVYVRGLLEHDAHYSLRPTLSRLTGDRTRYESLQQFLADSPWDAALLERACAERVTPELAVYAWVVDDVGIPKDGTHSPGVKRQFSRDLGRIRNCQLAVSVHAVGEQGALPLGWALHLPEEWCDDLERRRKAKIPDDTLFRTKPELARALCERAASWNVPRAPVIAGATYGDDADFRIGLDDMGLRYVTAVSPRIPVCLRAAEERGSPEPIRALADRLPISAWHQFSSAHGAASPSSRFAFVRVDAVHAANATGDRNPRWEWLIMEWPYGGSGPASYWLSNLPDGASMDRLATLAHLSETVEIDYRQLKGELGLDHYEGRSYLGFHHHCALVTCAHAFLTSERTRPEEGLSADLQMPIPGL